MWLVFFRDFNGVFFWHWLILLEVSLQNSFDTSGSVGFDIFFLLMHTALAPNWVQAGLTWDLMFLELFPLVIVIHLSPLQQPVFGSCS